MLSCSRGLDRNARAQRVYLRGPVFVVDCHCSSLPFSFLLRDLTENELKVKACLLLLFGTLCVTLFSDPLVDVITQVGDRLNVSPFYVAFVVTPFASNASEVYAGILFAKKKTNESISMTLATSQ